MPTPRRRSSRLRKPQNSGATDPYTTNVINVLGDGHHEPQLAGVSTPLANRHLQPESQEMHPAYFQSVIKKSAAAQDLDAISEDQSPPSSPSQANLVAAAAAIRSPARQAALLPRALLSSPTFDFRYTRPSIDMSAEARRLMDEVRGQAARIKDEIHAQRDEHMRGQDAQDTLPATGRRIAQPKINVRRFSDAHGQEFNKMESIAEHPSKFRVQTGSPIPTPKSLKRTNSKAALDNVDTTPKRAASVRSVTSDDDQGAARAKRAKHTHDQAQAQAQAPRSSSNNSLLGDAPRTPTSPIKQPASSVPIPAVFLRLGGTPTKASLARSASAKSFPTGSMIYSPTRATPSTTKPTPRTPDRKTEDTNKYRKSLANTLASVRSILRRPQVLFSDDPVKIAAGTHVSTPPKHDALFYPTLTKPLQDAPHESLSPSATRVQKHVNFTSSPTTVNATKCPSQAIAGTSSPQKMPGAFPPTVTASYPILPSSFGVDPSSTSPSPNRSSPRRATGVIPGDFTFRSATAISFAPNNTPRTPEKNIPSARGESSTPPVRAPPTGGASIPLPTLPPVPHGLSNKKRKRDSDGIIVPSARTIDEDKENVGVVGEEARPEASPAKKRARTNAAAVQQPVRQASSRSPSRLPITKRKGVLSMSRLNALARPKARK